MTRGRWNDAYHESGRAIELEPTDALYASQHALALIRLGSEDAAVELIETALANDPEDACGHLVKGWYHVRQKDFDRAHLHFREAIRLDPESTHTRAGMLFAIKSRSRLLRFLIPSGSEVSPEQTTVFALVTIFCIYGCVYGMSSMDQPFDLGAGVVPPTIAVVCVAAYRQLLGPYSNALVYLTGFGRPLLSRHHVQSMTASLAFLALGLLFLVPLTFGQQLLPWVPAAAGSVLCGLAVSDSFTPAGTLKHFMRLAFAAFMSLLLTAAFVCEVTEMAIGSRLWHTLLIAQCVYVLIGVFALVARVIRSVNQSNAFERRHA